MDPTTLSQQPVCKKVSGTRRILGCGFEALHIFRLSSTSWSVTIMMLEAGGGGTGGAETFDPRSAGVVPCGAGGVELCCRAVLWIQHDSTVERSLRGYP